MTTLALFCAVFALLSLVHGSTYVALPNGPGCSQDLIATSSECKTAAAALKYNGEFHQGSYGHAPPGCHVGHPSDSWAHVYFNINGTGTTGRPIYKSICRQLGTSKIPEALALTIPNKECLEEDNILYSGNDINGTLTGGVAGCANWCGDVEACKFWSYIKSAKYCWLKTKNNDKRINSDRISGTKACAAVIDGEWSAWSDSGACSATCGTATKNRERTCSNPSPKNGGKNCPGVNNQTVNCNLISCAIDGGWSAWSDFGSCSATCGTATKTSERTCSNPSPKYGGKICPGINKQTVNCNLTPCVTSTVAPVIPAASNQGCNTGEHGIACCPKFTPGDNILGRDVFIQEHELLKFDCQATCQSKYSNANGITQSTRETYPGNGKPKCWCEFGQTSLADNGNYETCMFN